MSPDLWIWTPRSGLQNPSSLWLSQPLFELLAKNHSFHKVLNVKTDIHDETFGFPSLFFPVGVKVRIKVKVKVRLIFRLFWGKKKTAARPNSFSHRKERSYFSNTWVYRTSGKHSLLYVQLAHIYMEDSASQCSSCHGRGIAEWEILKQGQ